MTPYETRDAEHARAGGVEDGLGVGGLDGGGDVGNVMREEAAGGRAALAVSRVVGGAGEARLAREEAEDGHEGVMNEAASAPVVSATSRETPTPLERASAYCPLCGPVLLYSY